MAIITFLKNTPTENQAVKIFGVNYQIICLSPDYVRAGEVSQINEKPASGILYMTTPPAAHITLDMTEKEVAELDRLSNKITKIIIEDYENKKYYYIDNPILVQKEDIVDGKKRYCFDSTNVEEQNKEIKKYKASDLEKLLLQGVDTKDIQSFFVLKKKSYKLSAGKNAKFIIPTKEASYGRDPGNINEATVISKPHKYRILSIDPTVNDADLNSSITYLVDWEEADEISSKIYEPNWYKITLNSPVEKNAWAWKVCCYVQKTTTFSDIQAELVEGDILKSIQLFCPEICNPKKRAELYYSTYLADTWKVKCVEPVERPIHGYPILTNWTYESRGKQKTMQDKYLKLYCYQVNEQGGSTFSGEGVIYHLPISDIEENEIRSNLAENPYIQFTTAEDSIHSQLYYVVYIYSECGVSSPFIKPKRLITSYKFCNRDYTWIICDDKEGKYKNVIFSIANKDYQEKIKEYNGNILKVNDEFQISTALFREGVDKNAEINTFILANSCNWIVIGVQYNKPMSFCCITDYINFSGINRYPTTDNLEDNCDEESIFLSEDDLKVGSLTISKDDLCHLSIGAESLISAISARPLTETTTKPLNLKKEDKSMKMNMKEIFGDSIGRYTSGTIKYSPSGLAFLTDSNSYVVYNVDTLVATDVANLVMDIPVYGIPVALKDLKKGDTIVYNEVYYLVKAITDTHISAINVRKGTIENLIPKTSIFGFSFYVKLVTPMENFKPDPSNPFNSMLPFLMLENSGSDDSMRDIMMMSMMSSGTANSSMFPLMMMMNKDGGDKNDLLMMMMLMGNNPFAPKTPASTSAPAPNPKSAPASSWTPQTALLNFPLDKGFMENE